ncbi:hypothetical protein [Kribbella ginsengisoli]|uniref:Phage portal protein n=1 Tax=Kribbella ginsengisoli TaxID=363865 RepID=A0ABP6VK16_9ACTN
MHSADRDVWRAIDRGERPLDWPAWFGQPEGADYLTPAGKDTAERAAADLTSFFGPKWLPQATQPGGGRRVNELGAASPVLSPTPRRRPDAFIEALRWWAALQFLLERDVGGIGTIRRVARSDISTDRFRHTLAQARLAAVAASIGAEVVLEPAKAAGPGDVLIRLGNRELFLEVVTFGPVPNGDDLAYDRHVLHLITNEDGVHWEGNVPGFLNKADEARWEAETIHAAARCKESSSAVEVAGSWGILIVRPGEEPEGRVLHGPQVNVNLGARLYDVLDKKAVQTRDAGVAWVWVEDYGGLYPYTPFVTMPLQDKLRAFGALAEPMLADRLHVGGVIWTRAVRAQAPINDDVVDRSGFAVQRGLPGGVVRETVTVHRRLLLPDQLRIVASLTNAEQEWLDWALKRLGSEPLAELIRQPLVR